MSTTTMESINNTLKTSVRAVNMFKSTLVIHLATVFGFYQIFKAEESTVVSIMTICLAFEQLAGVLHSYWIERSAGEKVDMVLKESEVKLNKLKCITLLVFHLGFLLAGIYGTPASQDCCSGTDTTAKTTTFFQLLILILLFKDL